VGTIQEYVGGEAVEVAIVVTKRDKQAPQFCTFSHFAVAEICRITQDLTGALDSNPAVPTIFNGRMREAGTPPIVETPGEFVAVDDPWSRMKERVIITPRLLLRPWREEDLEAFAALNADKRVMEFLPNVHSTAESNALAVRIREHFDRHGFGLWAVEVVGVANFVGFTGLSVPRFQAHFTPCLEVGWRLAYEHWGKGYATETAKAAVNFGFVDLRLDQIVSFTVPGNLRSRRVMERLGMTHSPADDFDHPGLPEGHRLRRHVLYKLSRLTRDASSNVP
jgi:RimJ/RimL family protein N-acetyltransferase